MIAGSEYVENILIIVHLLVLSLHTAGRSSKLFCMSMLNCKVLDDAAELWQIISWLRCVERGRAKQPCPTSFFWPGLPASFMEDLRCLTGRTSLAKVVDWGGALHARYVRAQAAVERLVQSFEPSKSPFDEQVSRALKLVDTSCEDCDMSCQGCAARNLVRRMKDLKRALDDFSHALNVCSEDFARLCENGFGDPEKDPKTDWCPCGKRKRAADEGLNEKCKKRRVE
ncbi:unnamed protein product [Agarophyton chilense]